MAGVDLRKLVLEKLGTAPMRPSALVRALNQDASSREVEATLSKLLDEGLVEFGSDRLLTVMHEGLLVSA